MEKEKPVRTQKKKKRLKTLTQAQLGVWLSTKVEFNCESCYTSQERADKKNCLVSKLLNDRFTAE